eukprot:gene25810-5961_t
MLHVRLLRVPPAVAQGTIDRQKKELDELSEKYGER